MKEILDRAGTISVRPIPVKEITIEAVEAEIARLEAELGVNDLPGFAT